MCACENNCENPHQPVYYEGPRVHLYPDPLHDNPDREFDSALLLLGDLPPDLLLLLPRHQEDLLRQLSKGLQAAEEEVVVKGLVVFLILFAFGFVPSVNSRVPEGEGSAVGKQNLKRRTKNY